jgi:hypothetical protein
MKKLKKGKTLPQLKKKALDIYSELVKLREEKNNNLFCYTCSKPIQNHTSDCHLSHFLSRGAYPGLTFHPDNSRISCFRCNVHLHGNVIEFRERLINEIGVKRVEKLESERHKPVKLGRMDFMDMIVNFREQIKELSET